MRRTAESWLSESSPAGLAAAIAPEDLACGGFVAILSAIHEYPSFFWCCDGGMLARDEPVRIHFMSSEPGAPFKIKAICLPFVFAKDAAGKHRTLDIRLCRLARLAPDYARKVRRGLRQHGTK